MSGPTIASYVEPSARTLIIDWTPNRIRQAEIVADSGDLRLAGDLCEAMFGDDAVQAVVDNRVRALLGCELEFDEGQGRKKHQAVKALEAEEDFYAAFPEDALTDLLRWTMFLNVGPGMLAWREREETGRVIPYLQAWSPRNLRHDPQKREWRMRVNDGGQDVAFTPGDGTWILHTPRGRSRPWMNGAWRAVSRWWLLKHYAQLDWGRYSDRQGQGLFVGTAPENVKKENRIELAKDLQNLGRTAGIALPPGYSLALVESTAKTWETFQAQIAAADKGITVALTGLNLTNEEGGSYAKAQSLGGIRAEIIKAEGESLGATLHDQALIFWAEFNYGQRKLAPWPTWKTEPPEDEKAQAEIGKARAESAVALAGVGVFTVNEVREAAGKEPLKEGGDALVKLTPEAPVAQQAQASRSEDVPAVDPNAVKSLDSFLFGLLDIQLKTEAGRERLVDVVAKSTERLEGQLDHLAAKVNEGNEARRAESLETRENVATWGDGLRRQEDNLGRAREEAAHHQRAVSAQVRSLADKGEETTTAIRGVSQDVAAQSLILAAHHVQLASGRTVPASSGFVQGQLYTDAVADKAVAHAANVLDGDVAAVIEAIEAGESYEDIRKRLLKAAERMSPTNLAKLTASALSMTELGGRHAINEDINDE